MQDATRILKNENPPILKMGARTYLWNLVASFVSGHSRGRQRLATVAATTVVSIVNYFWCRQRLVAMTVDIVICSRHANDLPHRQWLVATTVDVVDCSRHHQGLVNDCRHRQLLLVLSMTVGVVNYSRHRQWLAVLVNNSWCHQLLLVSSTTVGIVNNCRHQ